MITCLPAPVSKPTLFQTCLSPEQMKISCFSEGDGVQLILSLGGQIQSNDHNQSLNIWTAEFTNVTIILDGKLTGNLMCQVWNNVSRDEIVIPLAACSGRVFKLKIFWDNTTYFLSKGNWIWIYMQLNKSFTIWFWLSPVNSCGKKLVHISCDFRYYCMLKRWIGKATIWKYLRSILVFLNLSWYSILFDICFCILGSVTTLTVAVITSVIMLFFIVVLIVVVKRFSKKTRPTTVDEGK